MTVRNIIRQPSRQFLDKHQDSVYEFFKQICNKLNYHYAEEIWDAGSIADGDEEAHDVTMTGVNLGDFVQVSCSIDVADLVLVGNVTAADTVTLLLANNTGGAVDLGSATYYIKVYKRDL